MLHKKLSVLLIAIALIGLLGGCTDNSTPAGLNDMKRPLTLVGKAEDGSVLIKGDDGELICYSGTYYFSKTLKNIAIGDTIAK